MLERAMSQLCYGFLENTNYRVLKFRVKLNVRGTITTEIFTMS
jgi:hypothetical protein